jgi:hypothetical protein
MAEQDKASVAAEAQALRLRFKRSELVKVLISDTDFVLVFANGRKVLVKDGALRSTLAEDDKITFDEEPVSTVELFAEAETASAPADALPWGALSEDLMSAEELAARTQPDTTVEVEAPFLTIAGMNFSKTNVASIAGGLAALGLTGGGGSAAAGAPPVVASVMSITGMAGPFMGQNVVSVYDMEGKLIASGRLEAGTSRVKLTIPGGYSGLVMIQLDGDGTDAPDYVDEESLDGQSLDLVHGLRAFVFIQPGVENKATVSPVTELAVKSVLGDEELPNKEAPLVPQQAKDANERVGKLVGLQDITGPVVAMVGQDKAINVDFTGSEADQAQLYGAVLARLSGLEAKTGGLEATLDAMQTLVDDIKVAAESGDKDKLASAQALGETGFKDQLTLGAKLLIEAIKELAPDLAEKFQEAINAQLRTLEAPLAAVLAGVRAEQAGGAFKDAVLNRAEVNGEAGNSVQVALPAQAQTGDDILIELWRGESKLSELLKRTLSPDEAMQSVLSLTLPQSTWAGLADGAGYLLKARVSSPDEAQVAPINYLVLQQNAAGSFAIDTALPAAPTGALNNESQVRQTGSAGVQTFQQTPTFGGTYDAAEPGAVVVC